MRKKKRWNSRESVRVTRMKVFWLGWQGCYKEKNSRIYGMEMNKMEQSQETKNHKNEDEKEIGSNRNHTKKKGDTRAMEKKDKYIYRRKYMLAMKTIKFL